jgi:multidrug efflux pump subunit AcrA (membrane-fusion protein)
MTFLQRHLTLIGLYVVAPFIGPAACYVERAEARESQTAPKVIVRPVMSISTTALSIPRVALHQDEKGGPQVFVYSPAERRVHARGVALGTRRSGDVTIASGLEAGEMIVVGSRERLADGVVVQPINEPIVVTAAN